MKEKRILKQENKQLEREIQKLEEEKLKLEKENIELKKEIEKAEFKAKVFVAEMERYKQEAYTIEQYRQLLNLYEAQVKELAQKIYFNEIYN